MTSDGIECRVAGQSLKHCLNDLYAREVIIVEYLMARHFARTGQPSKDCDWGHDVLAELFPDANPIWRGMDAAEVGDRLAPTDREIKLCRPQPIPFGGSRDVASGVSPKAATRCDALLAPKQPLLTDADHLVDFGEPLPHN